MKFSKEKFLKNAPAGIKCQMGDLVEGLDGTEVIFDGRFGKDGYMPQSFPDGQEYFLYPIYSSWCI